MIIQNRVIDTKSQYFFRKGQSRRQWVQEQCFEIDIEIPTTSMYTNLTTIVCAFFIQNSSPLTL